jgi:hypothetical protein
LSSDPSITVQIGTNYKRGSGLRFQREDETRQIDEMSSLPLMPGEEGPSKWIQSVLGCAAYFVGINKAELDNTYDRDEREIPPALYIASPSFAIQIAQDPTDTRPLTRENREEAERNGSKNERGEGVILQEEAERFELAIAILRDNDDVQPLFNSRGDRDRDRDRGNWRNGQRGGNGQTDRQRVGTGARSKKKEEVVPEVKVLLRRPQIQGEVPLSDQSDSPTSQLMGLPDVSIPPPLGFQPKTIANSRSSNEISPPTINRTLPVDTKSPVSKFVPLKRETHPVRRYADSASSNEEQQRGGRGGRGGRGAAAGAGRGGGSGRNKNRERDSEFKNGNFVLLKRPEPPAPTPASTAKPASTLPPRPPKSNGNANGSSVPVPAPAPAKQVTILARKPAPAQTTTAKQESPKPTSTPAPAPAPPIQPPATSPARTLLQRPPRAPAASAAPAPTAPTAPRSFTPEIRGRGRGRGGGRGMAFQPHTQNRPRPPPTSAPAPTPVPAPAPAAPSPKPMNADAAAFEFDDAMLRPGYGSISAPYNGEIQPTVAEGPVLNLGVNGRGRGRGHAHGRGFGFGFGPGMSRGRGGFGPPHPHHHDHHHHQQQPHHHHGGFMGHDQSAPHRPAPAPVTPLGWQPAEPTKKIILQRPTS